MPTVVILVRTVNNTSDAKRAFLGPCRIVRRRCKFTCDVRADRTSQVALAVLLDIVANQRLALSPDQTQGTRPSSQGD
nr:MAG TPA: hypothetical protein [Caudoviricetes sp.]